MTINAWSICVSESKMKTPLSIEIEGKGFASPLDEYHFLGTRLNTSADQFNFCNFSKKLLIYNVLTRCTIILPKTLTDWLL